MQFENSHSPEVLPKHSLIHSPCEPCIIRILQYYVSSFLVFTMMCCEFGINLNSTLQQKAIATNLNITLSPYLITVSFQCIYVKTTETNKQNSASICSHHSFLQGNASQTNRLINRIGLSNESCRVRYQKCPRELNIFHSCVNSLKPLRIFSLFSTKTHQYPHK